MEELEEKVLQINAVELLKGLKPYMTTQEIAAWKEQAVDFFKDQTIVDIIFAAYKQGIGEYVGKYVEADDKARVFENKYAGLAIKVCEKFL